MSTIAAGCQRGTLVRKLRSRPLKEVRAALVQYALETYLVPVHRRRR